MVLIILLFFLRWRVCQNSQYSLTASNPKAHADKSAGFGRLWPRAPPPKLANQAPEALQMEIRALAPNERLCLEIPTDKPTMKLSVDEARANKKASRKSGILDSISVSINNSNECSTLIVPEQNGWM